MTSDVYDDVLSNSLTMTVSLLRPQHSKITFSPYKTTTYRVRSTITAQPQQQHPLLRNVSSYHHCRPQVKRLTHSKHTRHHVRPLLRDHGPARHEAPSRYRSSAGVQHLECRHAAATLFSFDQGRHASDKKGGIGLRLLLHRAVKSKCLERTGERKAVLKDADSSIIGWREARDMHERAWEESTAADMST